MLDLSAHTFVAELTVPARYNGERLSFGAVSAPVSENVLQGGGLPGRGDLRTVHVRQCEEAFVASPPRVGGTVSMASVADGPEEDWRVLRVSLGGGAWRLLCEKAGSRRFNTERSK